MGTHHQLLKIIFIQLCAEQNSSNNFGQIKHQQFFSTASQLVKFKIKVVNSTLVDNKLKSNTELFSKDVKFA